MYYIKIINKKCLQFKTGNTFFHRKIPQVEDNCGLAEVLVFCGIHEVNGNVLKTRSSAGAQKQTTTITCVAVFQQTQASYTRMHSYTTSIVI